MGMGNTDGCRAALVGAFAILGACQPVSGFVCRQDLQCGGDGVCESSGFCSFPDTSCASGRRYGSQSGSIADRCVAPLDVLDAGPVSRGDAGFADALPEFASFRPSNIPAHLMTVASNNLLLDESDGIVDLDTDAGTLTRRRDGADLLPIGVQFTLIEQPAGNPAIGVFSVMSIRIASGAALVVHGRSALAFAASGHVDISGTIRLTGERDSAMGGAGGFRGGSVPACDGRGPGGGSAAERGPGVGGGGGGYYGVGGRGGARGNVLGGSGGVAYGSSNLVPLLGGSGGACGGGAGSRASGGGGGGALQISASGTIRLQREGRINAGGAGGIGGLRETGGGGGGGAGGAVLLEGYRVAIFGVVAVNGGGGGAGAGGEADGEPGQPGGASEVPAAGGRARGAGTAGGAGAAGVIASGDPGGDAAGQGGPFLSSAGGGGGAGGRVYARCAEFWMGGGERVSPRAALTQSPL